LCVVTEETHTKDARNEQCIAVGSITKIGASGSEGGVSERDCDRESTLQTKRTPSYADRNEPLTAERSPATGRPDGRSVTGWLPESLLARAEHLAQLSASLAVFCHSLLASRNLPVLCQYRA